MKNIFFDRYIEFGEEPKPVNLNKSIRVNTLKITNQKLIQILEQKKVGINKINYLKNGYYCKSNFSLSSMVEHLTGYFYIQEAAAQIPVELLDLKKGEKVLDLCAAPGGKTTQIAALMNNTGLIISLDNGKKINPLNNNLERTGVSNCVAYHMDAKDCVTLNIEFDKVLIDAPCSGNFANDLEWLSRRKISDFKKKGEEQKEIILAGLKCLKKGGRLVYSTCSLEPEENEMVIDWIIRHNSVKLIKVNSIGSPGITCPFDIQLSEEISKTMRFWPWKTNTQGFFVAVMEKC